MSGRGTPSSLTTPVGGIGETRDQVGQGTLAAAVGANNGHRLAEGNLQVHPGKHRFARLVGKTDVLEHQITAVGAEGSGMFRLADLRLAIESREDPVGGRAGRLETAENVGQLPRRGRRRRPRGHRTVPSQPQSKGRSVMRMPNRCVSLENTSQTPASMASGDGRDAQHLGHRMAEGIVAGDPHGLVVVALAVVVELFAFLAFVGEGLDDLDAAEGLFERGIDDGHFFHRPAIGPLERLAPASGPDSRPAGQSPAIAAAIASRSNPPRPGRRSSSTARRISLPKSDSNPTATWFMSLVKRLIRSAVPSSLKVARSIRKRAAIEELAQVEGCPLCQSGDQNIVEDQEEILQDCAHQQHANDQDEDLKLRGGKVLIDVGLQTAVDPLGPLFGLEAEFRPTGCHCECRSAHRLRPGPTGDAAFRVACSSRRLSARSPRFAFRACHEGSG